VGQEPWFVHSEEKFQDVCERIKLTACPHCKRVGALICHGFLRGYDESSCGRKAIRARRIFCSNRNARPGCGRTFSIWLAHKVRRLGLTSGCLWKFLTLVVARGMLQAMRAVDDHLSHRALERIWKRFDLGQTHIRTALSRLRPPPEGPTETQTHRAPAAQVLAHLQAAFPHAECPIAAFQQKLRMFFL
jgi:hypothetical protein